MPSHDLTAYWLMDGAEMIVYFVSENRACVCVLHAEESERACANLLSACVALFNRGQGIFCVTRERERGLLMAVVCARPGSGSETRKRRVSLAVRSCLRFKRLN